MKIEIKGRDMKVTANQTREGAPTKFLLLRIGAEFGRYGFIPNGMTGQPTGSGTFVVTGYKD